MILRAAIFAARRIRWGIGSLWAKAVLRSYGVQFGPGLRIGSAPVIRRADGAVIRLGARNTIFNELAENPAGIAHRTALVACTPGAQLLIGDDAGISGAVLYAWERIEVGNRVAIGAGAAIYDSDFHPLEAEARFNCDESQVKRKPVVIEDDVWIGARAIVLKGVRIGRGAVVAAGAVVTQSVPAGSIVAGVPGRVVGQVTGVQNPKMQPH